MSDKIKLLPEVVANQIAAGEVVNRPSSVVKEMMENAIDAGARTVKVNFRDGGRDLIQIVDDGCGMSPIDARMAFDRHATSKIASVDDIYSLQTFGFRGEALASIAAVAQVELRTRQQGDEIGTQTEINGGRFAAQTPVMCPVGAQFFVRNLFYNVPARRKFLEKPNVAATNIRAEFQRVALCNPQIGFELYANDAPVYKLGATTLAGRIVDVVGRHIKQNLLEVSADTSIAALEGYIGRPAAAKKRNTGEQFLFVNGRYFKSTYLQSAIMKAYEKLIPENCAPAWFLYLTIDPSRIDVNVHPQKIEVKFADEEAVWQIVNAAVRETLAKTGAVPLMDFDDESAVEIPVLRRGAVYSEPRAMSNAGYNPFKETYIDPAAPDPNVEFAGFDVPYDGTHAATPSRRAAEVSEVPADTFSDSELVFIPSAEPEQQKLNVETQARFTDALPIGGGYVAASLGGRLVVADVRRARERIFYENYLLMLGHGSSVSEQLLFPEKLVLSGDEYALLEENAVEFAALGFDIDYLGEGTIEVKGTPADMPADAIDELLYELLQAFDTPVTMEQVRRQKIAAVMAREGAKSVVRCQTREEALSLLSQLADSGNVSFTPSGKAILTEISVEDICARLG